MKKIICAVLTLVLCFTSVYADGDAISKAIANTAEFYKDYIDCAVECCDLSDKKIDFDKIEIGIYDVGIYGAFAEGKDYRANNTAFFSLRIPLLDSDEIINVMYSKREKCDILSDKMIEVFLSGFKELTNGELEKAIADNNLPAPDMVRNLKLICKNTVFWCYYLNCGDTEYIIPYEITYYTDSVYNILNNDEFVIETGRAYEYTEILNIFKKESKAANEHFAKLREEELKKIPLRISTDEKGDSIYYVYGTKMTEDEYLDYVAKKNGEGEIKTDPKFIEPEKKPKTDVKQPETEVKKPDTEIKQPETDAKPNETNKTDEKPETALTDVQMADALKEKQLFKGTENGYELDKPLTRAEGTAMLVRLIGKEADAMNASYSDEFTDVSENDWFAKYVAFAKNNKIVAGTGDGNFTPERNMTAAEFTALVLRAFGYAEAQPENAFETAKKAGLMSDAYAEKIQKSQTFLRGDMVSIAYAAAKKYNL